MNRHFGFLTYVAQESTRTKCCPKPGGLCRKSWRVYYALPGNCSVDSTVLGIPLQLQTRCVFNVWRLLRFIGSCAK